MSLHISMDINGEVFGEVHIHRPKDTYAADNDDVITYRYDYEGSQGSITNGTIDHRPVDGATCLAVKTLTKIYDRRIRP